MVRFNRLHFFNLHSFFPQAFLEKSDEDFVNASDVCPSCYLLLNHRVEFIQSCYMTSLHGNGVRAILFFTSFCLVVKVWGFAMACLQHYNLVVFLYMYMYY